MEKIKYCTECGRTLTKAGVRADQVKVWRPGGSESTLFRLDSRFDEATGKENIAKVKICPKWKKWFNRHDKIISHHGRNYWM